MLKHDYFTVSFFGKQYKKDLAILGSKSKHGQPTHYEFIGEIEEVIEKH